MIETIALGAGNFVCLLCSLICLLLAADSYERFGLDRMTVFWLALCVILLIIWQAMGYIVLTS